MRHNSAGSKGRLSCATRNSILGRRIWEARVREAVTVDELRRARMLEGKSRFVKLQIRAWRVPLRSLVPSSSLSSPATNTLCTPASYHRPLHDYQTICTHKLAVTIQLDGFSVSVPSRHVRWETYCGLVLASLTCRQTLPYCKSNIVPGVSLSFATANDDSIPRLIHRDPSQPYAWPGKPCR